MERYHVCLAKEDLVFSASHFITFDGEICERLHGHNYRVAVEVHGPLDENHYVVDFVALKKAVRDVLAELDHRVILPTQHPRIRVAVADEEVQVAFDRRRWVFPRGDCVLLEVPNTTAELLARYIGRRLQEAWRSRRGGSLSPIRIEVDECYGQSAICELTEG